MLRKTKSKKRKRKQKESGETYSALLANYSDDKIQVKVKTKSQKK